MAIEVELLVGLDVREARQRIEQEGVRVKVVVEGQVTSLERGINRIVLIARDDRAVQAYWA